MPASPHLLGEFAEAVTYGTSGRRGGLSGTMSGMGLKVWIDQDLCTGDGLCVEICPALFGMHDDGLAYVKEESWANILGPDGGSEPALKMSEGLANVPDDLVEVTVEAAEECPGECIFIEVIED